MAQLPLDFGHLPALGRDDFLVAAPNETAVGWLERWPAWPQNALALHGPAGSGKSHLGGVFAARAKAAGAPARLIASDTLRVEAVPKMLGVARAVVVDDAMCADEEALLHLYNLLVERRGQLLIIAREPPARWRIALADLRSRLLAVPAVGLGPPDDALLGAVLLKLFIDRQISVAADVITYLLTHGERSFAAARNVVAVLDSAALAEKRPITVPFVRRVLKL